MRDGTRVRKTPRSITYWIREVIRLSTPSLNGIRFESGPGTNKLKNKTMKKFEDLEFVTLEDPIMVGKKARMHFENGYGVSVVSHTYSYGGPAGLYEIAVLDSDDNLTYDTPVTSDVIGYLSEQEVTDVMKQVQELV